MAQHGCPRKPDLIGSALQRCPFLGQLARDHGEEFARDTAQCQGTTKGPVLCESISDFHATFRLFHGAKGVVPLVESKRCPFSHPAGQGEGVPEIRSSQGHQAEHRACPFAANPSGCTRQPSTASMAPFAALSLSTFGFLPGPDEFIRRRRRRKEERRQRDLEKARQQKHSSQNRANSARNSSRMNKWRTHPIIGGLIPLNAAGKYVCPPLVVAGRAAVAQLKTTKALRPQKLPIKLLGVGGHCLAANIPCGMAREHTEKFSAAWFLAVHATVPYFGFLRKGVGMPKWAILMTLFTAIAGQAIGARLERKRLAWVERSSRPITAQDLHDVNTPESFKRLDGNPASGSLKNGQESGSKCPLIKTCEEMARCEKLQTVAPSNMILSN